MTKFWYEPRVEQAALDAVKDLDADALDDLSAAILARHNAIMAARLRAAGFPSLSTFNGHVMPYVLVSSPEFGSHLNIWATLAECRRLLDTVHNLPPAEAFTRWASRVEPLADEPYTRADAARDTQEARAALKADYAAGKITTDEYGDLHGGTSFMDLAPR
jgi:hypothetical protein